MTKIYENLLFQCIIKTLTFILCLCMLSVFLGVGTIIYNRYPPLFNRLLHLWPIATLIFSIIFQYFYFKTNFSLFLFLSGFGFILGLMFNINLHFTFYTHTLGLPIILMSLAGSILNYYIFKRRSILLLPFILIIIIASLLLLLAPLYTHYINSSNIYLYLIIIVLISTCIMVKNSKN